MCIQKKKLKQHAGTSSQQLIDTKRNDIQNRKYKDCPSIFKCNTNNEENTNKKIVGIYFFHLILYLVVANIYRMSSNIPARLRIYRKNFAIKSFLQIKKCQKMFP